MATTTDLELLRYPIGRYQRANEYNSTLINSWIDEIEKLPADLQDVVLKLNDEQLDTQYRPNGWTVRQVVHHLPDSHMNAYIRFRLAVTEDLPTIKPYEEKLWAELADSKTAPIESSLDLLSGLHKRWVFFLKSLNTEDFDKTFFHPAQKREVTLKETLGLYAWHGRHHLSHITGLIERRGW